MTTILASLLGLALYLLTGMILTHHTSLGRKYYRNVPVRFIFFWMIPIAGVVIVTVGLLIVQVVDDVLFDCIPSKEGLGSIYEK